MAKFTLDQLLDETGVANLGGDRMTKKAASTERFDFAKLAERCRRAADASPTERDDQAERELAEKTASIAVISRTLAEIQAIEEAGAVKTAAPNPQVDLFIKTALEQGHSPEAIAEFLSKTGGIVDRIKGGLREFGAARTLGKAERLGAKSEAAGASAYRKFQDHLRKGEGLGDRERDAIVSKLRVRLGDDKAAQLIADSPAYKNLPSSKGLKRPEAPKQAPAGPTNAVGVNVGNAQLGISADQIKKMKKPALAVGAGFLGHRALTSGKSSESDSKKSGVVVINR